MSGVADDQKFCLEFADFTGELTWLLEKAEAIEDAMGEQMAEIIREIVMSDPPHDQELAA